MPIPRKPVPRYIIEKFQNIKYGEKMLMLPEYSITSQKMRQNEIIRDNQSKRRQEKKSRRKMNKWGNRDTLCLLAQPKGQQQT